MPNLKEIIERKKRGEPLTDDEIAYVVRGYVSGEIPDYQVAALLMAIYFRGMDERETFALTCEFIKSGVTLELDDIPGLKVDKHSTGGVGDKVSLIVAPWLASMGLVVPMISGRGLGHTGGTLDKLESIPGVRTDFTVEEFKQLLRDHRVAIVGQTDDIVPADRKFYELRDITSTVDSLPLMVASIMSKKLVEDLDVLVLDVKCGTGAFMKTRDAAEQLASLLVKVGQSYGVKTDAVITNMDVPLGRCVGNTLEVKEAIEFMRDGKMEEDLKHVVITIIERVLELAGVELDYWRYLESGAVYEKFVELVAAQGGDTSYVEDTGKLRTANHVVELKAWETGNLLSMDTERIGWLANHLGAGRFKKGDKINHAVGFVFWHKTGDIHRGDVIAEIHADDRELAEWVSDELRKAIRIG